MCSAAAATGKELLGSNLPAALWEHRRTRNKTGFSTPIGSWLKNSATFMKPNREAPCRIGLVAGSAPCPGSLDSTRSKIQNLPNHIMLAI